MTKEYEHILIGGAIIAVAAFVVWKLYDYQPASAQTAITDNPAVTATSPTYPIAATIPQGYNPPTYNIPGVNLTYNVPQSNIVGQSTVPLEVVGSTTPLQSSSGCGCDDCSDSSALTYSQLYSSFPQSYTDDMYENLMSTGVLQ